MCKTGEKTSRNSWVPKPSRAGPQADGGALLARCVGGAPRIPAQPPLSPLSRGGAGRGAGRARSATGRGRVRPPRLPPAARRRLRSVPARAGAAFAARPPRGRCATSPRPPAPVSARDVRGAGGERPRPVSRRASRRWLRRPGAHRSPLRGAAAGCQPLPPRLPFPGRAPSPGRLALPHPLPPREGRGGPGPRARAGRGAGRGCPSRAPLLRRPSPARPGPARGQGGLEAAGRGERRSCGGAGGGGSGRRRSGRQDAPVQGNEWNLAAWQPLPAETKSAWRCCSLGLLCGLAHGL